MTREEAIKDLTALRGSYREDFNGETIEALTMAIEALKRQIQKKVKITPLRQDVRIGNMTAKAGTRVLARCPNCDTWVMRHHGFCSHCGQAIDWSEEE